MDKGVDGDLGLLKVEFRLFEKALVTGEDFGD